MFAGLVTEANKKWWTLAAVSFGLFMIMLDNTVVNVALPAIQRDLGVQLSELEWIVSGYALSFAALMLTGGKLADAYGRRLLFVTGIAVFTLASLGCGLAPSGGALIAARIVQGAGAALMNPATLSIIAVTFPPRQRGTAIGIWAGVSALALAIGPLIGGLLTEHASWNWIFFVNVPIGVLGVAASFLLIEESRDQTHERLDLPGLLTSGVGLFSLTYALIEANNYGWGSAADRRGIRARGGHALRLRPARASSTRADARPDAVPQPHVRRGEPRDAPGRAGDVRRLLLRLALHAERARLLGRPGGRDVPADDGPDHPPRPAGRTPLRPVGVERADGRRHAPARGAARVLQPAPERRDVLAVAAGPRDRRRRDGDDDDAERGGGDAIGPRRRRPAWAPPCSTRAGRWAGRWASP